MCYSLLFFLSGELRNHCGFIIVSVSSTWELTRKQTDSHMNHTDWFDSLNQPELDIAQIFHWITTSISVCLSNQTWNIVHMLYDYFYNYFNIFASLHLKKKKKKCLSEFTENVYGTTGHCKSSAIMNKCKYDEIT